MMTFLICYCFDFCLQSFVVFVVFEYCSTVLSSTTVCICIVLIINLKKKPPLPPPVTQGCDLPEQSTVHVVLPPSGASFQRLMQEHRAEDGEEEQEQGSLTRLDLSSSRLPANSEGGEGRAEGESLKEVQAGAHSSEYVMVTGASMPRPLLLLKFLKCNVFSNETNSTLDSQKDLFIYFITDFYSI